MNTHYDNLQVSRNASQRVIRAAYKSLSQEWHPDKHPSDRLKAERIIKIINKAYEVLSDPELKAAHDKWIDDQVNHASEQYQNNRSNEGHKNYKSTNNASEHEQDNNSSRAQSSDYAREHDQANKFGEKEKGNDGISDRVKKIAIGIAAIFIGGKFADAGGLVIEWIGFIVMLGGLGALFSAISFRGE